MENKKELIQQSIEQSTDPAATLLGRWLSVVVILVRVVVGVTFIFSGIVKLIDPAGTAYKIEDYLMAFNMPMFIPTSMVGSIVLSYIELIIGINTLLGSYLRTTPILLLIFMAVMTPVTLFLAIANPIHDCGCFGDAIHLTNWQTFGKNVILLTLSLFLYKYNTKARSVFHREIHSLIVSWCTIYAVVIVYFALSYMPILDFRPYKIGVDIPAAVYGENDEDVVYEFVYEKDGERQSFTIDNLPDETEGWTFVSREEKNKSRKKVINDLEHFVLYSGNDDVTDMILELPGFQFLMLSPDLTKANDDDISRVHELYDYCNEYEYPFYAVTSSSQKEIDAWIDNTGGEYPFLFMDKTTIRTIDRNNPFILILNDGVIHYKYPIKAVPDESKLDRPFEQIDNYAQQQSYNADVRVAILLAGLVVPILILYFAERVALYILRSLRRKLQEKAVGSSEEDK